MLSQVNGLLRAHSMLIILKYINVDSLFSLQFHLWAAKIICLKFSHLEKTRQPKFVVNRHFKAGAGPDKDFVGIFIFSFFSHLVFLNSPSFVSLGVGWDYWGSRWQTDKAQFLCNNDQQISTTTHQHRQESKLYLPEAVSLHQAIAGKDIADERTHTTRMIN